MKKIIYILILTLCITLMFLKNGNAIKEQSLKDLTVVIDPGHGGVDPGTIYGDIYEKNINLKISLYLKKYLEYYGSKVIMIRDGDYDLSSVNANYRKKSDFDNRIKIINQSHANLYLSIHLNYLDDSRYYGSQVFYGDKILAKNISESLNTTRDSKPIPESTYMYNKLKIKGVLIECGFISNEEERNKLITSTYQKSIAKQIAKGIIAYYKYAQKEKV